MQAALRIFLDANILFSAAKSDGAVRRLLRALHAEGHILVADGYVAAEAKRNIAAKGTGDGGDYLQALLARIEVNAVHYTAVTGSAADWLPEKDRPVLLAAIACRCNALVTGDSAHFEPGYGHAFDGVTVHSPAQLAFAIWGTQQGRP